MVTWAKSRTNVAEESSDGGETVGRQPGAPRELRSASV